MDLIITLGPLDGVGNPRENEFNSFQRFKPDRKTVARLPEHNFRRFQRSYTGLRIPARPNTFQNRDIWGG